MYFSIETLMELWFDLLLPSLQVAVFLSIHGKEQGSPYDGLVPGSQVDHMEGGSTASGNPGTEAQQERSGSLRWRIGLGAT